MAESKTWRRWKLVSGAVMLAASLPVVTRAHAAASGAAAADAQGTWPAAVASTIADAEYRIGSPGGAVPADGEPWQAPNRAHGFRTFFGSGGITIVPRIDEGEPSWRWNLRLVRWGRAAAFTDIAAAAGMVAGNEIAFQRGALVERYVNDRRGLEQIFRIEAPPAGDGGDAKRVALDLALSGDLLPVFAGDGQAVDFATSSAMKVLRYGSLRVVDSHGEVLPSWIEPLAEGDVAGMRLIFEDAGAVYPVTVDPLTTSAAWSVEGDQVSAALGYSVATAGDVNGDGYSDVIVGVPFYDNGQSDEGRAYVYLGSASGLATSPAWTVESDEAGANLGWAVASAGDIDADGFGDVIVGAPFYDNSQGRVTLYRGSATGLSTTPAWTMESGQGGARMGNALGTAGDVNGDGYADVIVGAYSYSNGQGYEGRAYVFLGSASGLSTTASWTAESDQVDAEFATSVATAGDVNGDGYADVIVGAPFYDNGSSDEGRAYVYLGSAVGVSATAAMTMESDQISAGMGKAVSTAGDVNGDGYADVLVGAPGYDDPEVNEGRLYIYLGSASGLQPAPIPLEENQAGAGFGGAVATAGDVNGDGYADVIGGASGFTFGGNGGEGRAFLFAGYGGGIHLATWTVDSGQAGAGLGFAVATAGDVNGDGYSDVIIGAQGWDNGQSNEGQATVYLGSAAGLANSPFTVKESNQTGAEYGATVASAGDVNGDGYSDVLVGAPLYDNGEADEGRVFLYLGIPGGININPDWTAEGNVGSVRFGAALGTAGDVNGDGYADVIVGAPGNGATYGGRAYVYLGSPVGLAAAPSWTGESAQLGAEYGSAVAGAGDVSGDGFADVIVGAPAYSNGESGEGRTFVYLGSASGLATSPVWTQEPNQAGARFGHAVASAGDVNADGFSDIIVGAIFRSTVTHPGGEAYVYLGSPTGPSTAPRWTGGTSGSARYGASVASAGDVNGDGYADVIVGAYAYDHPDNEEGGAFLYLGGPSGPAENPAWSGEGDQTNADYGSSVASAGDVNGDGYGDVVVGVETYSNGQSFEGRAYVYLGSAAGLTTTPSWSYENNIANSWLGASVASAGDVNGDGFADVIVGAPAYASGQTDEGAVYLFLGGDRGNGKSDRRPRQARLNGTTPIAPLGVANSETAFRIRETGRTPAGTDRVRMEWEVKPLGTPFDGTGIQISQYQVTDPTSGYPFNEPATGLLEGTFYHWRARLTSRNPFFPHTLWVSQAGSNVTETKLRTQGCLDRDGDGYGELSDPSCASPVPDCNDDDPLAWGMSGPTGNLQFTSKTVLVWDLPADPGAPPSELRYDTLRSGDPGNFLLADCVETYDGPNTIASDTTSPSPGFAFYYLTRARSSCGIDPQSLGTNSAGVPRPGRTCP
jgi:hypothetical protein